MPEDENIFDEEYTSGSNATPQTIETEKPSPKIKTTFQVEMKRYGISKPKRVIIRAKIDHDQD